MQWGPPPAIRGSLDVDPVDLTALLTPGKNVLGVEVLYYGHGDGTWPAGKPGMIFHLTSIRRDGHREQIVSDPSWQAMIDRRTGRDSSSAGSSARCRKSSTPGCIRSAGTRQGSPPTPAGRRPCRSIARPTSRRVQRLSRAAT